MQFVLGVGVRWNEEGLLGMLSQLMLKNVSIYCRIQVS